MDTTINIWTLQYSLYVWASVEQHSIFSRSRMLRKCNKNGNNINPFLYASVKPFIVLYQHIN